MTRPAKRQRDVNLVAIFVISIFDNWLKLKRGCPLRPNGPLGKRGPGSGDDFALLFKFVLFKEEGLIEFLGGHDQVCGVIV